MAATDTFGNTLDLLKPKLGAIPLELRKIDNWVLWRALPAKDGRIRKVPFTPKGLLASSTDAATWSSFCDVSEAYARGGYAGVGFVVDRTTEVVGVDIDKLVAHKHQSEVKQVLLSLARSGTYVEWSPSGTGLRAFLLGNLPFTGKNNRTLGVEVYGDGRYLTVTGARLPDVGVSLVASQSAIDEIIGIVFPPLTPAVRGLNEQPATATVTSLSDAEVLHRARAAKNGAMFTMLWEGRWTEYYDHRGELRGSQSEADLALCLKLAFWTGKDANQIDRLFRQSGLMRPKWDAKRGPKNYGEITITKAISSTTDVYLPQPADQSGLEIVSLDRVAPQPLDWLWPGFLPLGKVSLLSGNPGLGKSQITLDVAARVSTGAALPTGEPGKLGRVILVSAEDDPADTIVPRLIAARADLTRIRQITAVRETAADGSTKLRSLSLERDLERIGAALRQCADVALVVIDPISAYLGKTDSHNNAETRALMEPLSRVAQEHNVAVLLVSHLNKGSGEAIYRTAGSIAFVAAARAAFAVVKDDSNPVHRFMLPIKTNLAKDSRGIGYEVREASNEAPYIVWDQQAVFGQDIESLMQQSAPGEGEKLREAMSWLRDKLSMGPALAAQAVRDAKKDGIAERTLERAKQKLGVKASLRAGRWEWCLPQTQPQIPAQPGASAPSMRSGATPPHDPWNLGPPPDYIRAIRCSNL